MFSLMIAQLSSAVNCKTHFIYVFLYAFSNHISPQMKKS